jgi:transmembrane sensor
MSSTEAMKQEAVAWLVRTNDPEFTDWDAFTAWLEQDPAHADAYHRLADSERLLTPLVADAEPVQDNAPLPSRASRRRWGAGAAIAVAAILATFGAVKSFSSDIYTTRMGEQRTVALGDGDQLLLNGGTEVAVTGWSRRDVRVERGQALFRLASHEGLEVRTGDLEIVDIGTVFEVSRTGDLNHVVVDEGAVVVDPGGAALRLERGQQLAAADGAAVLTAIPAAPGAAGGWTRGQLVYLDAPVAEVAVDLRRSTGLAISTSSAIGARRFSGTLSIADVRRDPRTLGPLLGLPVRPVENGWRLGEDK